MILTAAFILMIGAIIADPNNFNFIPTEVAGTIFIIGLILMFIHLHRSGRASGGEY